MRRKTIPCFFALICGILLVYISSDYFDVSSSRAVLLIRMALITALLLSAFFCLRKRQYTFAVVFCFVLGCFVMINALLVSGARLDSMFEETGNNEPKAEKTIIGVVTEVQKKDDDYYRIELEHSLGKTLVSYYREIEDDLAGRAVKVTGEVSLPKPQTNPGCFDYRMYLKTKNIDTVMTCSDLEVLGVTDRISRYLADIRSRFEKRMSGHLKGAETQIITAMLFGDKSQLDEDVYESFQRNGTAHILAVSGLHIGMIYSLIVVLIGGRRKIKTNIFIGILLVMYAALAGFSPSVVRAVVMIILHIIARLSHMRYDIVSAAVLTAGIMLIWNPYQIFSTGFQMSFLAVLILGFCLPLFDDSQRFARADDPLSVRNLKRIIGISGTVEPGNKKIKGVKKVLLAPLIIQIGMTPLTAYQFNYLSIAGVLANVPVVFLAGLIVPFGVICLFLGTILPVSMGCCYTILGVMTKIMVKANDLFYLGGKTSFDVSSPPLIFVVGFYFLGFYVLSEWARIKWHRKEYRIWLMGLAGVVISAVIIGGYFNNDFLSADCVFVDVGQGACVHLRTPGGSDYLFDGGGKAGFSKKKDEKGGYDVGKKILRPYLLKNGVRKVDIAFVTHLDADHYQGIASICRLGMVKKLGLHECLRSEEEKVIVETGMKKKDIIYFSTGERLKSKDFELDILGPAATGKTDAHNRESTGGSSISVSGGQSTSENENSMVGKAIFRNRPLFGKSSEVSVLITGDIDESAEGSLISQYAGSTTLDCDIMAVPHHGSRYSSSEQIIRAVSPAAAVIQVGKNPLLAKEYDIVSK